MKNTYSSTFLAILCLSIATPSSIYAWEFNWQSSKEAATSILTDKRYLSLGAVTAATALSVYCWLKNGAPGILRNKAQDTINRFKRLTAGSGNKNYRAHYALDSSDRRTMRTAQEIVSMNDAELHAHADKQAWRAATGTAIITALLYRTLAWNWLGDTTVTE